MKLIHISDLHIGVNSPFLGREGHYKIVLDKIKEISGTALDENIRFILIAGDVFDSNAVSSSLAIEFFNTLRSFPDVNFVIIPGGGSLHGDEVRGHDAYTKDSIYNRLEVKAFIKESKNIHLILPDNPVLVLKEHNITFHAGFFDYPVTPKVNNVTYNVAIIHGAFGDRTEFGEKPIIEEKLAGYNYVALGHYHRFKKLAVNAAYSGALVQFEFLPYVMGTSGFVVVEIFNSSAPQIEYREFKDSPRFIYFKVLDGGDLERLKNEDLRHTYVKITAYVEDFKEEIEKLKNSFPDNIHTSEASEIKKESLFFVNVLDKILGEKVEEEHREEIKELLLYGLQVSARKSDFENFIKDRYNI